MKFELLNNEEKLKIQGQEQALCKRIECEEVTEELLTECRNMPTYEGEKWTEDAGSKYLRIDFKTIWCSRMM